MQDEPLDEDHSGKRADYSAFTNEMEADELAAEIAPAEEAGREEEEIFDLQESDFTQHSLTPPGPGLPESLLWIAGMMMVQIFAQLIALVVLVLFIGVTTEEIDLQSLKPADIQTLEKIVMKEHFASLLGITQGLTAIVIFLAVIARLGGRQAMQKLPVAKLHVGYSGLLLVMFIPVLVFTNQWHAMVIVYWNNYVLPLFPFLKSMEKLSSMHLIQEMITTTPLWALLLIIAVAPAITEELIFRGLIGRGLVARWGIVPGIVLTSVLFAAVHLSPTHVIALLPLAVVLHLLHLATRSIWAPMLLHFLNNAFAIIAAKVVLELDQDALEKAAGPPEYSLAIFMGSGLCLCALCWLLWTVRYRFETPDGTELPEGYIAAEVPRQAIGAKGSFGSVQTKPIIASALGGGIFVASVIYANWDKLF